MFSSSSSLATRRRAPKPRGSSWLHAGGRYRLTEERIRDHEPIYLLGRFETPRFGSEQKDRLVRSLLSTWKQNPERMAGFDRDGDGDISLSEWEHARTDAQRIAGQAESRHQAEPPLSRVVDTSDRRRPFLIATIDGSSLYSRPRLYTIGGTTAFFVLASGIGFALIARLL